MKEELGDMREQNSWFERYRPKYKFNNSTYMGDVRRTLVDDADMQKYSR